MIAFGITVIICLTAIIIVALINRNSCRHHWVLDKTIEVYSDNNDKIPAHHKYIYRCDKCGKIKIIYS